MAKVLKLQLHQSFQWIFRISIFNIEYFIFYYSIFRIDWFDLLAVKGNSRVLSNTTVQKHQFLHTQHFLLQLSHLNMTTRKTIALTWQTFVSKEMSLLFNILSRFVIPFLLRSKHLLILWLLSPSAVILEPKNIKSVTASTFFPIYLPWSDGTRCHDLSFLNVEFQN